MNKHAYLIMAHNNPKVLDVLLQMIDDERNDIFLHVDKNSDLLQRHKFSTHRARLCFTDEFLKISWGGYSQIACEMLLFRTARAHGPYAYYHLISGSDLPLKSQDYIHAFCQQHQGAEFIGFVPMDDKERRSARKRVGRYWALQPWFRTNNVLKKALRNATNLLLRMLPRRMDMDFQKGCNWVSLTEECVDYLLQNAPLIQQRFSHCYLADENYKQTLVYTNPTLRSHIFDPGNEAHSCLREIDWTRGKPYTWTIADHEQLSNSDALFARKFSDEQFEIVEWVKQHVGLPGDKE